MTSSGLTGIDLAASDTGGAIGQIIATSPGARRLQALAELDGRPVALLIGGETTGISDAMAESAELLVSIPPDRAGGLAERGGGRGHLGLRTAHQDGVLAMLTERIRGTIGRDIGVASFIRGSSAANQFLPWTR